MQSVQDATPPLPVPPRPRFVEDGNGHLYDCAFREFVAKRLNPAQLEDAETLRAVALAGKKLTQAFETSLNRVGLTHAQYKTLMAVRYSAGAGAQMGHIAAWLGVTPRNVTATVDALEALGLVSRVPDPADRRAFILTMTPLGEERTAAALRLNQGDQKRVMGALTLEEKQLLRHLCTKLVRSAEEPAPRKEVSR